VRVARQLAAGLLLAGAASALPQETFAPVQELLAGHQLAAALERAEEFEDELLAEQSRVYVLHESGDLVGALAEGLRALERTPDDPFLLEECGGVAAALGQVEILRTLAPRLEALASRPEGSEAGASALAELERLDTIDAASARALRRARLVCAFAALACIALWRAVR